MSTYCDKIIGYSVDVLDEWENLDEDTRDKWESLINNELDYVGYNHAKQVDNKVTVIYDGMDGRYCKLFFVNDSDVRGGVDDDEDLVESINKLLETANVPFDIKQKIKGVYREIFGKELNRTSMIKASYLIHWH